MNRRLTGITIKPIEITLPSKDVTDDDDWHRKYKLGTYIYDEHGGTRLNEERMRLGELVDYLDRTRLYAMLTYKSKKGANPKHVWFLLHTDSEGWLRIEATGSLGDAGVGAGPGIYKLKQPVNNKKNWYQAWDWGHWYKPTNPDIENRDYS